MPLYEYRCPGCRERWTLHHSFDEASQIHACPGCGAELRRVLSPVHHRWAGGITPFDDSNPARRRMLDPGQRDRTRDEIARKKEEKAKRDTGR